MPEFSTALPDELQLDGELVALDESGQPDFHRLSRRMLHGDSTVPVTLFVLDVLAVEGMSIAQQPYRERRALLEELELGAPHTQRVATFDDGAALFDVCVERELEGVVAKRERDPYRAGERGWVKTKNRNAPRFAEELAGATARSAPR